MTKLKKRGWRRRRTNNSIMRMHPSEYGSIEQRKMLAVSSTKFSLQHRIRIFYSRQLWAHQLKPLPASNRSDSNAHDPITSVWSLYTHICVYIYIYIYMRALASSWRHPRNAPFNAFPSLFEFSSIKRLISKMFIHVDNCANTEKL